MSKGFLYLDVFDMVSLIAFGIFMGLAFSAPPGIVLAETFRRGVVRGFPDAFSVQLGALIGDTVYCLLALAGVAVLVQNPITQRVLGVLSVVFLLYLAVSGILAELRAARTQVNEASAEGRSLRLMQHGKNAFLTGVLLSLTNPWAIGFWLSLGGTVASYGAMESGNTMAMFFAGFFGACLCYALLVALVIGVTRRAIPTRLERVISIACSAVIGILGLGLALRVLQLFLNG